MEYKIKYLDTALKDLENITDYITNTLHAPQAALDFIDELDKTAEHLKQFPYSHKIYLCDRPLLLEYRVLPIKNYLLFYVVVENAVEIHSVIYSKRDIEKIIKMQ